MRRTRPHAPTQAVAAAAALMVATLGPAGPGRAEPGAKPSARAGSEKAGAPPVIACPSLANYRMLMHDGPGGAAARLADPKADHLGCAALPRKRIAGIVDRVALGGQNYACAEVQGTSACHWFEADAPSAPPTAGGR